MKALKETKINVPKQGSQVVFKKASSWSFFSLRTFIIFLIVAGVGGWYWWSKRTQTGTTQATIARVSRGKILRTVSGTGKMVANSQWDLRAKATGDLVSLPVKDGAHVHKGDMLARLDDSDARKVLRDARVALEEAKVAAGKQDVESAAIATSVTPEQALSNSLTRITKFYADYAQVDNDIDHMLHDTTIDPNVSHMHNVDYLSGFDSTFSNYPAQTEKLYIDAKGKYNAGLLGLDAAKAGSDIDRRAALTASEDVSRVSLSLMKMMMDLLRAYEYRLAQSDSTHAKQAQVATYRTNLQGDINTANTAYQDFLATDSTLLNYKQTADVSPYDLQSSVLAVRTKANAVSDALDKLDDYVVRAPGDGIVANIAPKVGDHLTVESPVLSVISDDMKANLSLAEVDAAQVAVGMSSRLTFDALPGVAVRGVVTEKDVLGTVVSGVVSYTVKVTPDASATDTIARILPNMSVSADIEVAAKEDVLRVPTSAVKRNREYFVNVPDPSDPAILSLGSSSLRTQGGGQFAVRMVTLTLPLVEKVVTTGFVGDTETEILTGLAEEDRIVTKTTTLSTAPVQQNVFQAAGIRPPTGGARRPQ